MHEVLCGRLHFKRSSADLPPAFPTWTWRWGSMSYGCSLACAPVSDSTNGLVREREKNNTESQFLVCTEKRHPGGAAHIASGGTFCSFLRHVFSRRQSTQSPSFMFPGPQTSHDSQRDAAKLFRRPSRSGHEATLPPTLAQGRSAQHAVLRPRPAG